MNNRAELGRYVQSICQETQQAYTIDEGKHQSPALKKGLRNADGTGVVAGVTRIGSVLGYEMKDGKKAPIPGRLLYRGVEVSELVSAHSAAGTFGFEETCYLLLLGRLPNTQELQEFTRVLAQARQLPRGFNEDMILKAPSSSVMNQLSRSILALYSYDKNPDDTSAENMLRQSIELVARFPVIVASAYTAKRHHHDGDSLYLHPPQESLSISENFLRMIRPDKSFTAEEAHLLDLMMILHAEHGGGNNSTFACRVLSSTGTDTYSAISAAVNSLKGPLHGGANAQVGEMFRCICENVRDYQDDDQIRACLEDILDGKLACSQKIYGLGHAVYTMSDPRTEAIRGYAAAMADRTGYGERFALLQSVERLGIPLLMERKRMELPICANVDLYSGLIYEMLGIPQELFTPLFALARVSGWCAHRMEEVLSNPRIIRPAYLYDAQTQHYRPIEER